LSTEIDNNFTLPVFPHQKLCRISYLLQLGPHELLARVEHVLDGVKAADIVGRLDYRLHGLEQRGGAAGLEQNAPLAHEQAALAEHVAVQVPASRATQDFAVDQVQDHVDGLARYVAQVVLARHVAVGFGEPDLERTSTHVQ